MIDQNSEICILGSVYMKDLGVSEKTSIQGKDMSWHRSMA